MHKRQRFPVVYEVSELADKKQHFLHKSMQNHKLQPHEHNTYSPGSCVFYSIALAHPDTHL